MLLLAGDNRVPPFGDGGEGMTLEFVDGMVRRVAFSNSEPKHYYPKRLRFGSHNDHAI